MNPACFPPIRILYYRITENRQIIIGYTEEVR